MKKLRFPALLSTLIAVAIFAPAQAEDQTMEAEADSEAAADHWAYQPIRRFDGPKVMHEDRVRSPIDRFVFAKLEEQSIEPSPRANRATLFRRLHLDLVGLNPTPYDVRDFLADERPDAYERAVERLLASPAFGERWARHWLDLARYADSDGYEKDRVRPHAWRYRDWVIEAINRNLPFDEFSTEQLAGDLLPGARLDQIVATGFHRNTLHNTEGGADPEEDRVKKTVDRINTTGAIWLGLTVGCCQCHDHKYDALSQSEYYSLYAFFNSLKEVDVAAPLPHETERFAREKAAHDEARSDLARSLEKRRKELRPGIEGRLRNLGPRPIWTRIVPRELRGDGAESLTALQDGSVLVQGANPDKTSYTLSFSSFSPDLESISALRLEVLTDKSLPKTGPGRAPNGNFVLSEIVVSIVEKERTVRLPISRASATFSQRDFDVDKALVPGKKSGWGIGTKKGSLNQNRKATFVLENTVKLKPSSTLQIVLRQVYGGQHSLGKFRFSATSANESSLARPERLWKALATPKEKRNKKQNVAIESFLFSTDAEYRRIEDEIAAFRKLAPKAPATRAQTLSESGFRKTFIHKRGNFLDKGERVTRSTPASLPRLAARSERPDRLDFARWLMSPSNPLTARVTANRYWKHLFGFGIVRTVDDFGVRGDLPTHPKLLDWLASRLVELRWSRKAFLREIVLSETYRLSSRERRDLIDIDPLNKLLARQNRLRLEAESIRDVALQAGGLLSRRIGGPSVRPPLPPGVAELGYAGSVKWPESSGGDRYRRGLYIFMQRTVPYPMLTTFDAPESTVTCARRERSNTPVQALTLLNDPVFVECAQTLAIALLKGTSAPRKTRIEDAFLRCLGRLPDLEEVERCQRALRALEEKARASSANSAQLLSGTTSASDDLYSHAAWVALSRVLLNLDETLTRE